MGCGVDDLSWLGKIETRLGGLHLHMPAFTFLILFSLPRFLLALPPFIRLISAMPPKGGNAKKEGGRAKKAENEVCRPHEILSLE